MAWEADRRWKKIARQLQSEHSQPGLNLTRSFPIPIPKQIRQWHSEQVDAVMEEQEHLDPSLIFARCPSPNLREVFGPSYKGTGGSWGGRSPVK